MHHRTFVLFASSLCVPATTGMMATRSAKRARVTRQATTAATPASSSSAAAQLGKQMFDAISVHSDPAKAKKASVYIRSVAPCFGVQSPQRREAVKSIVKTFVVGASTEDVVALMDELWTYSQREMHYTAVDVMKSSQNIWTSKSSGQDAGKMHDCLVRCSQRLPWWDTIDFLSRYVFDFRHFGVYDISHMLASNLYGLLCLLSVD